jgi:hypothetical protein
MQQRRPLVIGHWCSAARCGLGRVCYEAGNDGFLINRLPFRDGRQ